MHERISWQEEKRSAYLYRIISDLETNQTRQLLFLELAQAADMQAELWVKEAAKTGNVLPNGYTPDVRTRVVVTLLKMFGPRAMRSILAAMKVRGMVIYSQAEPEHVMPTTLSDVGKRHKGFGGGNLRAAVFGVNDGLVSIASLVMGVAGAAASNSVILLSAIAGLLAGAFSMAAGEYISVRSQREMFEYQIGLEKAELDQYPQEEAAELALIFMAKGLSKEESKNLADIIIADPDRALDTLAREELGLNPGELGSPVGAALFSFVSFAVGGMVPVLPFVIYGGPYSLVLAIGMTAVALFGVGAVLSLFTGRHAWLGGMRMLLIGGAAGAATYIIGKVLGVVLS